MWIVTSVTPTLPVWPLSVNLPYIFFFIFIPFSDWQISLNLLVFFSIFQYFSVLYLMILKNAKIYLRNLLQLKNQRKIKTGKNSHTFPVFCVKFHAFSSILGKIPWLFEDWKKFTHFQVFQSMWEPRMLMIFHQFRHILIVLI